MIEKVVTDRDLRLAKVQSQVFIDIAQYIAEQLGERGQWESAKICNDVAIEMLLLLKEADRP